MTTISNVITFARTESSVLPDIDRMTFAAAEREIALLFEAAENLAGKGKDAELERDFNFRIAAELRECILKSPPKSLADTLVIMNSLASEDFGVGVGWTELHEVAIKHVRDFVAGLVPGQAA